MCARTRDSDTDQRSPGKLRAVWWIGGAAILAILAILAFVFLGRDIFGQWARLRATRDMDAWAIRDAQRWLNRADRIDPDDGNTELLRAKCYRHLEQWDRRAESLKLAEKQGADLRDLRNEVTLGQIASGELSEGAENKLEELTESGIAPADIAASFIEGRMVSQYLQRADLLLQAWAAEFPDEPHVHYIRGMLALRNGDTRRAREEFERTLAAQPRHELAVIALARLYGEAGQYDQALQLYVRLGRSNPSDGNVMARLAQVLRQLGRIEQARQVLTPAVSQPEPLPDVMVEAGQIELESAHYEAALQWFLRGSTKEMTNHATLSAAATALSMLGDIPPSQRAYAWIADEVLAVTVMQDLRARLESDPRDQEAASELQQRIQQRATRSADVNPLELATTEDASASGESPGRRLYVKQCFVCHGTNGGGDGHAARFVYPRPRNLRSEKMRLVTARNGVPTRDDVMQVIRQGVPGTAMTPLEGLRDDQLEQLADVVQEMRRDGAREKHVAMLQADDEEVDSDEVEEVVTIQITPEGIVAAPPLPAPDDSRLKLGSELYTKQSCHSCHGETGVGDVNTPLFDDLGRPAFPRDLVQEVFKGGDSPQSIYLRTLLGMPGSPHPANVSLTQEDMIGLALYVQSLGQEPKRKLTNHQRAIQASTRPAAEF